MLAVGQQRDGEPVPQHQDEHREVHRGPPEPRGQVADEGRAVGELMAERQRDRQVGVQVQEVPRLVAHPAAGGAHRDDPDAEQKEPGHGGHQHVGVLGEQRRALAHHVGVRGGRVAPHDEQAVRDHQADDVPPAHGVPAGQFVGAQAPLQWRQPRHQRDQDHYAVSAEQAEDFARAGQPAAEPVDAGRTVPPQGDDHDRAGDDDRQHATRADPGRSVRRPGGHRPGRRALDGAGRRRTRRLTSVRPRLRLRAGMASRARSPGNAGHPHLPLRRPSWSRMRSGQDRPSGSRPWPSP